MSETPDQRKTFPGTSERARPSTMVVAQPSASSTGTRGKFFNDDSRTCVQAGPRGAGSRRVTAQSRGDKGMVQLSCTVDPSGRVLNREIVRSSGHREFDNEVMSMIERAQPLRRACRRPSSI